MKTLSPAQIAKLRGHKGLSLNSQEGPEKGIQFEQMLQKAKTGGIEKEQFIPESHKKAAKGMEKQFLQYMVEQMKKTVDKTEESSTAMDYYDSVLTEKHTEALSDTDGGLGLRKMILDQVYPEHMRTEANYRQHQQRQEGFKKYKDNVQMHSPQQSKGFDSVQLKGGDHE